jgi:hypothetical protein
MPPRLGLFWVHRLLIGMSIGLSAILLAHGIAEYAAHRDLGSLLTGVVAAAVGVGLALYLRWFLRKR